MNFLRPSLLICTYCCLQALPAQDWPRWLGPHGTGVASTETTIRREYTGKLSPAWQAEIYKPAKFRRDGGGIVAAKGVVYVFHLVESTRKVKKVWLDIHSKVGKRLHGKLSDAGKKAVKVTKNWADRAAFEAWLKTDTLSDEDQELLTKLATSQQAFRFNHLTAYQLDSGKRLWQAKWAGNMNRGWSGGEDHATMSVVDDVVYLVESDGTTHARSAKDGSPIWKSKVKVWGRYAGHNSSPLVHDGRVFLSSQDKQIALSCKDGSLLWASNPKGPLKSTEDNSNAIYTNAEGKTLLLAPSTSHRAYHLFAMDPATGSIVWHIPNGGTRYMTPVVSGNRLVTMQSNATSKNPGLYIYDLDATPPKLVSKWLHKDMRGGNRGQNCSTPVVSKDRCYFGTHFGLFCFSINDGKQLWSNNQYPSGNYSCGVLSGDLLISMVMNKGWGIFEAETGKLIYLHEETNRWHSIDSPILTDGRLLYKAQKGKLKCFDLRP